MTHAPQPSALPSGRRLNLYYSPIPSIDIDGAEQAEWLPLEDKGGLLSPMGGSLRIVSVLENDASVPNALPSGSSGIPLVEGTRVNLLLDGSTMPLFEGRPFRLTGRHYEFVQPVHARLREDVVLSIVAEGEILFTTQLRRDPRFTCDEGLFHDLADFEMRLKALAGDDGTLTWGSFHQAIENGDLCLLKLRLPVKDNSRVFLSRLERSVPHLRRVFDRPRFHLKIEEEVRPVGSVRRTGPASLRHIASHTEHWEARTVAGLRPARLLAQVAEDEDALYENRVAVTLAERLLEYLNNRLHQVQQAREQIDNALDWQALAEDLGDYRRRKLLELLLPKLGMAGNLQTARQLWEEEENQIRALLRVLMPCFASPLYQSLRRKPRVGSPLRPTNILLMDAHYHAVYILWGQLDTERQRPEVTEPPEESSRAYLTYSDALILTGLKHLNFYPATDNTPIGRIRQDGRFAFEGLFQRDEWEVALLEDNSAEVATETEAVQLLRLRRRHSKAFTVPESIDLPELPTEWDNVVSIEDGQIVLHDRLTTKQMSELRRIGLEAVSERSGRGRQTAQEQQRVQALSRRWNEFLQEAAGKACGPEDHFLELHPVMTTLGSTVRDVREVSEGLLTLGSSHKINDASRDSTNSSVVVFAPFSVKSASFDTPPRLIRRLYTHGYNLLPEDAQRWGSMRRSVLPLSPYQVNSLLRVLLLLQSHTNRVDIAQGERLTQCPVCTEVLALRDTAGSVAECSSCGARWGSNACVCGHRYAFITPTPNRHRKQMARVVEGVSRYAQWTEFLENEGGESAVCGSCEASREEATGLYICPSCGRCPREAKWREGCIRCQIGSN